MQTLHGIAPTDDGRYVMVSLRKKKSGVVHYSVRRWGLHDKIRTALLLHRGVYCGMPSFWQPAGAPAQEEKLLGAAGVNHRFRPSAGRLQARMHEETFADNLLALVPDDAFLCSIPLFYGDLSLHSFFTAYRANDFWVIGVIINKELRAVFKMAPGTVDALEAHLGRIKRSWKNAAPNEPLPEHVYVLNLDATPRCDEFFMHPLRVSAGKKVFAEEELRALGCALAGNAGGVGFFPGAPSDGVVRIVRTAALAGGAVVLMLAALATLLPAALSGNVQLKVRSSEARYRTIITNNLELKTLCDRNDSLARTILQLQKKSSRQTQWGRFLDALGESRPVDLYFDKLGSEPAAGSASKVRIAISGSAKSETLVTDFMTRLQKSGTVSNVSLSFLEKNEKNATICNFRIICLMNITVA